MTTGVPLTLQEALDLPLAKAQELYKAHINSALLGIFKILGFADLDIVSAEGTKVRLADGRELTDFSASIGVLGLGHNHPRIIGAERACHERKMLDAIKVAPNKLQGAFGYSLQTFLPDPIEVCFPTVSGAEAVEAALKIAERIFGKPNPKFLCTSGSFHGKTHASLALTTGGGFQRGLFLSIPAENIIEVPYADAEAVKVACRDHKGEIACGIVEGIQGQGLDTAPDGYMEAFADAVRGAGGLVIFDEVKMSMGRTGKFCSFMHSSAVPDIVTISKSLGGGKRAVGAALTSKELFEKAFGGRKNAGLHTTTFGGMGESCAVAIEALNVLRDDDLIDGARRKGEFLREKLVQLQEKHPGKIREFRGRGLMQGVRFKLTGKQIGEMIEGIEVPVLKTVDSVLIGSVIRELLDEHNIMAHISPSDPDILHIMPPLIVTEAELTNFVDALDTVIDKGFPKLVGNFLRKNLLA